MVYYANITNDAVIVACEKGQWSKVGWSAPIVQNLSTALDNAGFTPKIIKLFYDGSYFMADQQADRWNARF